MSCFDENNWYSSDDDVVTVGDVVFSVDWLDTDTVEDSNEIASVQVVSIKSKQQLDSWIAKMSLYKQMILYGWLVLSICCWGKDELDSDFNESCQDNVC